MALPEPGQPFSGVALDTRLTWYCSRPQWPPDFSRFLVGDRRGSLASHPCCWRPLEPHPGRRPWWLACFPGIHVHDASTHHPPASSHSSREYGVPFSKEDLLTMFPQSSPSHTKILSFLLSNLLSFGPSCDGVCCKGDGRLRNHSGSESLRLRRLSSSRGWLPDEVREWRWWTRCRTR